MSIAETGLWTKLKREMRAFVESRVQRWQVLGPADDGTWRIRSHDPAATGEHRAKALNGLPLTSGDDAVAITLGGKPLIIGVLNRRLGGDGESGVEAYSKREIDSWRSTQVLTGILQDVLYGDVQHRAVPKGGSSGQVLTKASGDDQDVDWETPSGGGTFYPFSFTSSGVSTTTNISSFHTNITWKLTLGSGTWTYMAVGSAILNRNTSSGGVVLRIKVAGSSGGGHMDAKLDIGDMKTERRFTATVNGTVTVSNKATITLEYRGDTVAGTTGLRQGDIHGFIFKA